VNCTGLVVLFSAIRGFFYYKSAAPPSSFAHLTPAQQRYGAVRVHFPVYRVLGLFHQALVGWGLNFAVHLLSRVCVCVCVLASWVLIR
jgi:hypothetical protein